MEPTEDILDLVQGDVFARLSATPKLSVASIIQDDEKTLETKVEQLLTKLGDGAGKMGLCLVVMKPEIIEAEKNLPGPSFKIRQQVQVIEHAQINASTRGSKKRASLAVVQVLRSLHHADMGEYLLYAEKGPAAPLPMRDGFVGYMVTVLASPPSLATTKPAPIQYALTDGELVLECATSGASIFYTLDGTYPSPSALPYTVPIPNLPLGTTIRSAAYAPEMYPGDAAQITINP